MVVNISIRRGKVLVLAVIIACVIMLPSLASAYTLSGDQWKWNYTGAKSVENSSFESWNGNVPTDWQVVQEPSPTTITFYDDCTNTKQWTYQSYWPNAVGTIQTGVALRVSSGKFYSDPIPSLTGCIHGPLFTRTLDTPMVVRNNLDFRVQVVHPNPSSMMNSLYVVLYDKDFKIVISSVIVDAWYATRSDATVYYWFKDGTYQYRSMTMNTAWSGEIRVWYDNGQIRATAPGSNWAPIGIDTSESARVVTYVALFFGRNSWYEYASDYVDAISLSASGDPIDGYIHNLGFHDSCANPAVWTPAKLYPEPGDYETTLPDRSDVKNPDVSVVQEHIPLSVSSPYSSGNSFVSDSIPTYNADPHGPVFYRQLETPFYLYDKLDLRVDLEHIYQSDRMGHAWITLYDAEGMRVFSCSIIDAWYGDLSYARVLFWDENGNVFYQQVAMHGSWCGVLRVWFDSGYIKGSFGGNSWTLRSPGQFDYNRAVVYAIVTFGRLASWTYDSKLVRDIAVYTTFGDQWASWSVSKETGGNCRTDPSVHVFNVYTSKTVLLKQRLSETTMSRMATRIVEFGFWCASSSGKLAQARIQYTVSGQRVDVKGPWVASYITMAGEWKRAAVSLDMRYFPVQAADVDIIIAVSGVYTGHCFVDDATLKLVDIVSAGYCEGYNEPIDYYISLAVSTESTSYDSQNREGQMKLSMATGFCAHASGYYPHGFYGVESVRITTEMLPLVWVPVWPGGHYETTQRGALNILHWAQSNDRDQHADPIETEILYDAMATAYSNALTAIGTVSSVLGVSQALNLSMAIIGAVTGITGLVLSCYGGTEYAKPNANNLNGATPTDYYTTMDWAYDWVAGFAPNMVSTTHDSTWTFNTVSSPWPSIGLRIHAIFTVVIPNAYDGWLVDRNLSLTIDLVNAIAP